MAMTAALRLLDPCSVRAAVPGARAAASLADGLAGTALLHARLAAADPQFEDAAIRHWAEAGQLCAQDPAPGGIYAGPGGLAASLIIGSGYLADPGRCQAAASRGVRWLSARALAIAAWQEARRAAGQPGTPWPAYDLISGLAGLGRILLAAAAAGLPGAGPGLEAARDTLTAMILSRDGPRPGWWQPAAGPGGTPRSHAADVAATGLAHGIAGPLAFLSACQQAGHGGPAQQAAIGEAARWLSSWRQGDSWPPQVTRDDLARGPAGCRPGGRRDAWCYGAPGIGRALGAAGEALGDEELASAGQAALAAQARRPAGQWDTEGPGLCHGGAGILQCASGSRGLRDAAAAAVTADFQPAGTGPPDRPGFLSGSAGIALALADYAGLPAPRVATRWDAVLLLS